MVVGKESSLDRWPASAVERRLPAGRTRTTHLRNWASFLGPGSGSLHTGRVADSPGQIVQSAAAAKATETLSQFLARILDQLSLSAWLPSAAIVFIGGLSLSLRTVLDDQSDACGAGLGGAAECAIPQQIAAAMSKLASTEWGGALLSIAAIIVLTMLTQAFAFEAIRVLEGFWGTSWLGKWFADSRSARHASVRKRLTDAHLAATAAAWELAKSSLTKDWEDFRRGLERGLNREFTDAISTWKLKPSLRKRRLQDRLAEEMDERLAECPHLSPDMIDVLEAAILQREPPSVTLSRDDRLRALNFDWESRSNPDLQRRRLSLSKRLRDYPEPGRESPTRLGNIMRHHEDLTGERLLEGFIIREFDNLPFSIQVEHDDQRNRLDVYCTMVFVLPIAGLLAALTLLPHTAYAITALGLAVAGCIISYRAAMATARAYGLVLLEIAEEVQSRSA